MTTPISFLNQLLKHVLPHAATDPRLAGLLLVARGQQRAAQALLCHPTLRMQRDDLAQYRVGQEKLADMDLIKSGRWKSAIPARGKFQKSKWVSDTSSKTSCPFRKGLKCCQHLKPCPMSISRGHSPCRLPQQNGACFGITLQRMDTRNA